MKKKRGIADVSSIEPRRVELAGVRKDGRVPLRRAPRLYHLPPFRDALAIELDVVICFPLDDEQRPYHPQCLQRRRPGVAHPAKVELP